VPTFGTGRPPPVPGSRSANPNDPSGPAGYLIDWASEFTGPADFHFGDQEDMGLGVRVATPLAVRNGGRIVNSDGLKDERQVWVSRPTGATTAARPAARRWGWR
jgi:hypothetical protein